MNHNHSSDISLSVGLILAVPFALALGVYAGAAMMQFRRAKPRPWYRSVAWVAGVTAAACTFVGPIATESPTSFVGHMVAHALIGMEAPFLIVLGAPVTLALRSLDVVPARRLSRILNSLLAQVLTHPVVAVTVNIGILWLLYRSPLYGAMQQSLLVHSAVMTRFLVAGVLLTASIIPIDPAPHRASYPLRTEAY